MQEQAAQAVAKRFGWYPLVLWLGGTVGGWAFGFLPGIIAIVEPFCCRLDTEANPLGTFSCLVVLFIALLSLACRVVAGSQVAAIEDVLGSHANERKWLRHSTFAMTFGWVLGWLATVPIFTNGSDKSAGTWILSGLVIGTVVGFVTSVAQWLVLRRLRLATFWWIGMTVVGWSCACALYWLVYRLLGGPFEATYTNYEGTLWAKSAEAPGALPAMLGAWLVGGLVLAAITGVGMMVLLRGAQRPEQANDA